MKRFIPILTLTAALSLPPSPAAHGQGAASASAQTEPENAQSQAQKALAERQEQLAEAQYKVMQAKAQASRNFQDRIMLTQLVNGAAANSGRTLIVRSSDHDPNEQANLEEDLAVMSRIFDKAVSGKPGDDQQIRTAMGIDVYFTSERGPLRNVYLDGYGALFMLNVSYPLLPPPAKSDEEKEKASGDSAWQEAREELFGQVSDSIPVDYVGEEYAAEKVNNLKNALLEALKDATNIRNLKPDDSITVCVFGSASARPAIYREQTTSSIARQGNVPLLGSSAMGRLIGRDGAAMHGTIMTIRVKKTDVDSFSKGKLNLVEFRKRASITIYAGGGPQNLNREAK
jgi:hypothetical protein